MSLSINTNVAALQAQRFLGMASQELGRNQERLASGLRLNSAADDAAGVAISARMTAQIRGMSQAARNANDAISMVQTAESGLKRMEDILNQMREKAVQSSNETNTASDRASLDDEYQQLLDELDRISQEQSFNGLSLLDGNRGTAKFQIGPDTDSVDTISVNMNTSMRTKDIGSRYQTTVKLQNAATTAGFNNSEIYLGSVALDWGDVTEVAGEGKVTSSAWGLAEAINNNTQLNVDAVAQKLTTTGNDSFVFKATGGSSDFTYVLSINGQQAYKWSVAGLASGASTTLEAATIASAINDKAADLGVSASTDAGALKLFNTAGGNILVKEKLATANDHASVQNTSKGFFATGFTTAGGGSSTTVTNNIRGTVQILGEDSFTFKDAGGAIKLSNASGTSLGQSTTLNVTAAGPAMNVTQISSYEDAQTAIQRIDYALADVDTFRGELGAAQNRFEYTIENLEASVQNLTDARSRIMDADIAKEAADMMMNNVRRQASSAVLAQANMNPQLALQLLGG